MKNKVFIKILPYVDRVEYDIVAGYEKDEATLARCWDYLLAERIRKAVERYMKENCKNNSEEK